MRSKVKAGLMVFLNLFVQVGVWYFVYRMWEASPWSK